MYNACGPATLLSLLCNSAVFHDADVFLALPENMWAVGHNLIVSKMNRRFALRSVWDDLFEALSLVSMVLHGGSRLHTIF